MKNFRTGYEGIVKNLSGCSGDNNIHILEDKPLAAILRRYGRSDVCTNSMKWEIDFVPPIYNNSADYDVTNYLR